MKYFRSYCAILATASLLQSTALAQSRRDDAASQRTPAPTQNEALELQLYQVSQALLQDPQNPELLLKKGVYLSGLGRLPQAIEIFEALRLAYPNHPAPYVNLASVYARQGHLEQAREMLQKSDVLGGNRFQTQLSLASVHLELALVALNKANEIKPGDPQTLQKLKSLERFIDESNKLPFTMAQSARAAEEVTPLTPRRSRRNREDASIEQQPVLKEGNRLTLAAPEIGVGMAPVQTRRSDPAASPAVAGGGDPRRSDLLAAVDSWTRDWSARQFPDYAAHYSARFQPSDGISREAWSNYKQQILERARYIRVNIAVHNLVFDGNIATMTLDQKFRSDRYADRSRKEMQWILEDGNWKIVSEKNLN